MWLVTYASTPTCSQPYRLLIRTRRALVKGLLNYARSKAERGLQTQRSRAPETSLYSPYFRMVEIHVNLEDNGDQARLALSSQH